MACRVFALVALFVAGIAAVEIEPSFVAPNREGRSIVTATLFVTVRLVNPIDQFDRITERNKHCTFC